MHSFEVDSTEKIGKDYIFDIDILPNRAHDCLSHIGVAREISAILNLPYPVHIPRGRSLRRSGATGKGATSLNIEVKESELCRRYVGRIIEGVKVKESPKWLKERLEAIGQKTINNIVDATNYIMFEMGQPLHAFDADKICRKDGPCDIFVRKAGTREKIITLDGQKIELDKDVLVIADEKDALAIAGIKGGKKAEVDEKTINIILEAANFEPINIRKTSRRIGLRTESSIRFENEITPELTGNAMDRLTGLILEISDGKAGSITDFYPKKADGYKVGVHPKDLSKLLGAEISEKEIREILERLGFKVKKSKGILIAAVPPERLDVRRKEDLIEEVGRIYGYEKIKPSLPEEILLPPKRNDNFFYADIVRDILIGAGFSEVYNYSFGEKGDIELENPIAKDKKFLRNNLLDGLKQNIENNLRYFKEARFFEIGKIFQSAGETVSFAGIISNGDFYEIKGVIEMMFNKIGITDIWFNEHPQKTSEIMIGNTSVGHIDHGEFEINFEMLVRMATEEVEYRPISKYPAVKRDIAVFVPLKTKVIEIMDVIENTAGMLLIDTDLFDIYESEEKGRKSFAFHLIFQSQEKTLSEKEINGLMNKITDAIDANSQWEVRR